MKNTFITLSFTALLFLISCSKSESPSQSSSNTQATNDTTFGISFDVGSTHYKYTSGTRKSVNAGSKLIQQWDLKDSTFTILPGVLQIEDASIKIGSLNYYNLDLEFLNNMSVRYCWGKNIATSTTYGTVGNFAISSTDQSRKFISGTFSGYFHAFYNPGDSIYVSNGKFKGFKTQYLVP